MNAYGRSPFQGVEHEGQTKDLSEGSPQGISEHIENEAQAGQGVASWLEAAD